MVDYNDILQRIRDCAFKVRTELTPGYLESVYRNALFIELREAGFRVEKEARLTIEYHGEIIGDYRADLLVDNQVIIELKAVSELHTIHEQQLVNYLKTTGLDVGVLINYGAEKFRFIPKYRTMDLLNQYR